MLHVALSGQILKPHENQRRFRLPLAIIEALSKIKELGLAIEQIRVSINPITTHENQGSNDIIVTLHLQPVLSVAEETLREIRDVIRAIIKQKISKVRAIFFRESQEE